jgi:hypothetical protein
VHALLDKVDRDGSGEREQLLVTNTQNVLDNVMNVQALMDEVDRNGSGECEYPEFVEIMTLSLDRLRVEQERSGEKQARRSPLCAGAHRLHCCGRLN